MPRLSRVRKGNKNANKMFRCPCAKEHDKGTTLDSGESSLKAAAVIEKNSCNSFASAVLGKYLKATRRNMFVSSIDSMSMSGGIIENSIKYMMRPINLLRFCLLRSSALISTDWKYNTEEKGATVKSKNEKKEDETEQGEKEENTVVESSNRTSSHQIESSKSVESTTHSANEDKITSRNEDLEKEESDNEESGDEMMSAMEHSDSCDEQWDSATSKIIDMSIDHCNIIGKARALMEEPIDILAEEYSFDKTCSLIKVSQDNREPGKNGCSRTSTDKQESGLSIDEDISQMFQKQCTSSEEEFVSSAIRRSLTNEKLKPRNFLYKKIKENCSEVIPQKRKGSRNDGREQMKKTPKELMIINKRRKMFDERVGRERIDYNENRSTQQATVSDHESKTQLATKDSNLNNAKYKEIATQTDSAFSDDDVEMIDMKHLEKSACWKYASRKFHLDPSQIKKMERKLHYIADNEDSNDPLRIVHRQISSSTTPSSSSDLSSDEHSYATSNADIVRRRRANFSNITNTVRTRIRAPPGFPEIPQNAPLSSDFYASENSLLSIYSKENINLANIMDRVPPAPTPMRHLYYDYPEFMDLPFNINEIQNNIFTQYYY